jgi:hypothetical protein
LLDLTHDGHGFAINGGDLQHSAFKFGDLMLVTL